MRDAAHVKQLDSREVLVALGNPCSVCQVRHTVLAVDKARPRRGQRLLGDVHKVDLCVDVRAIHDDATRDGWRLVDGEAVAHHLGRSARSIERSDQTLKPHSFGTTGRDRERRRGGMRAVGRGGRICGRQGGGG